MTQQMNDDFMERMWPRGVYPCPGGCGATVERSMMRCPACQERMEREEAEARQRAEQTCLISTADAAVPRRFAGLTLDSAIVKKCGRASKARKALDALSSRECPPIVLSGPAGAGKSVTACALLRSWIIAGGIRPWDEPRDLVSRRHGMYVTAIDLANARRDSGFGEEPEIIGRAIATPLLVIDDVGQETLTEPCRAAMREVIWARYDRAARTVYTTARTEDWITQAHGDGFTRRMFEGAIEIAWPWGSK